MTDKPADQGTAVEAPSVAPDARKPERYTNTRRGHKRTVYKPYKHEPRK